MATESQLLPELMRYIQPQKKKKVGGKENVTISFWEFKDLCSTVWNRELYWFTALKAGRGEGTLMLDEDIKWGNYSYRSELIFIDLISWQTYQQWSIY